MYIPTASQHINAGETKYQWLGEEPIICIGLADNQLNDKQLQLVNALSEEGGALMQKYYYLGETLTEQEMEVYNQQVHRHDKQAYLHILMEAVQAGTRHMYIYDPAPAAPVE